MLQPLRSLNLLELTLDISFIFHLKLNGFKDVRIINISPAEYGHDLFISEILTPEDFSAAIVLDLPLLYPTPLSVASHPASALVSCL